MSPDDFRKIDTIFREACLLPEADRAAYVDRTCHDDRRVRDAVLAMLRHDSRTVVPLDSPVRLDVRDVLEEAIDGALPMPERIGAYRIVRQIGEGGFGVVYLAQQESPRREVAVKVLRA